MSDAPAAPGSPQAPPARGLKSAVIRYLSRFDDGEVARWAFRGLLIGAIAALALDLRDLGAENGWTEEPAAALPSPSRLSPGAPATPAGDPMRFTLVKDGVLRAEGTIDVGAAERLKAELDQRGEYVEVVSLDSPGGSLHDALAMSSELRRHHLSTRVEDGAACASSCPLVLAGGVSRSAGTRAAIGVHQFYAAETTPGMSAAQSMADAQATTALISRHLLAMGVDPALWLHALDTPPGGLYALSPDELKRYRLVTEEPAPPAAPAAS